MVSSEIMSGRGPWAGQDGERGIAEGLDPPSEQLPAEAKVLRGYMEQDLPAA